MLSFDLPFLRYPGPPCGPSTKLRDITGNSLFGGILLRPVLCVAVCESFVAASHARQELKSSDTNEVQN